MTRTDADPAADADDGNGAGADADAGAGTVTPLGAVDPAGSRQLGRRSALCAVGDAFVAGLADGTVAAFDADALTERWRVPGGAEDGSVVSLTPVADGILAGERGPGGQIRFHDADGGAVRWRYRAARDVGDAATDSRFFLPFVADLAAADDAAYAVVRRYERGPDGERRFESAVYAFAPDGGVRWRRRTDASPVALDADGERVAVAFNRCPGSDRDGLLVLDAVDGAVRRRWDPPGDGERRVGDVSLRGGSIAATSHADYRGYLLDAEGVRWTADLGCPVEREGTTVYAYPNHVHAGPGGVVFVTGNTYPEEGRETTVRHPAEHTAVGVAAGGTRRWSAPVGGFAHGIAAAGDRVAVPVAQHFRERDPGVHAVHAFDAAEGRTATHPVPGIATAAALADGALAAVEEPVSYHDGATPGAYRLRSPA